MAKEIILDKKVLSKAIKDFVLERKMYAPLIRMNLIREWILLGTLISKTIKIPCCFFPRYRWEV